MLFRDWGPNWDYSSSDTRNVRWMTQRSYFFDQQNNLALETLGKGLRRIRNRSKSYARKPTHVLGRSICNTQVNIKEIHYSAFRETASAIHEVNPHTSQKEVLVDKWKLKSGCERNLRVTKILFVSSHLEWKLLLLFVFWCGGSMASAMLPFLFSSTSKIPSLL